MLTNGFELFFINIELPPNFCLTFYTNFLILLILKRKEASNVAVNTNTMDSPIIPKIGPIMIKPTINIDTEIALLIKTNLLFSELNNFDV